MLNRRENERLFCAVPVDGKRGGIFDQVATMDLSTGGLGFVSSKKVPLHSEIAVELDLTGEGDFILVKGKVKWVKSMGINKYRIGLCFENILDGEKSQLTKCLAKK